MIVQAGVAISGSREATWRAITDEDGGFVFLSTMRVSPRGDGVTLASAHETIPQGLVATLQSIPMRLFCRGVILTSCFLVVKLPPMVRTVASP